MNQNSIDTAGLKTHMAANWTSFQEVVLPSCELLVFRYSAIGVYKVCIYVDVLWPEHDKELYYGNDLNNACAAWDKAIAQAEVSGEGRS